MVFTDLLTIWRRRRLSSSIQQEDLMLQKALNFAYFCIGLEIIVKDIDANC